MPSNTSWIPSVIIWSVAFIWLLITLIYFIKHRTAKQLRMPLDNNQASPVLSLVWAGRESFSIRDSSGGLYRNIDRKEDNENSLEMDASISVNTLREILLEVIELDIGGTQVKSNWLAKSFTSSESVRPIFYIPLDLPRGKRTVRICYIVNGKPETSEPFTVNLPQKKQ